MGIHRKSGRFTTYLVTAELFVASNLSVFLQRNNTKVRRNWTLFSLLPGVQFLRTFVVFLCKKTDKLLATFFSAVTALVVSFSASKVRYGRFSTNHSCLQSRDKEIHHHFTCMQISSAIGGPKSSNRMQGKIYIPVIHELVCGFLDVSGAKNRKATIPSFTAGNVLIFWLVAT
jgi:hypothetical protein